MLYQSQTDLISLSLLFFSFHEHFHTKYLNILKRYIIGGWSVLTSPIRYLTMIWCLCNDKPRTIMFYSNSRFIATSANREFIIVQVKLIVSQLFILQGLVWLYDNSLQISGFNLINAVGWLCDIISLTDGSADNTGSGQQTDFVNSYEPVFWSIGERMVASERTWHEDQRYNLIHLSQDKLFHNCTKCTFMILEQYHNLTKVIIHISVSGPKCAVKWSQQVF